ncbi:unnamed protein product, partial [Ectocarpus sp. 12 AP-2014]
MLFARPHNEKYGFHSSPPATHGTVISTAEAAVQDGARALHPIRVVFTPLHTGWSPSHQHTCYNPPVELKASTPRRLPQAFSKKSCRATHASAPHMYAPPTSCAIIDMVSEKQRNHMNGEGTMERVVTLWQD